MANVVYDVIDDEFHFDYLMAGITAILWFRVIVLMKLTESFGPLVVMIFRMTLIILQFLLLLSIGLITFASIATMTLSELDAFRNMYEAIRVYADAVFGDFDLYQYDSLGGWKQYYGYALHVAVLFFFLILLLNLLIAIMSDEYAILADFKTGLYWSSVIPEMPKF